MAKPDAPRARKNSVEPLTKEPVICSEMLDEMPDSIIIHDADRNIVYANRYAYESRGYSAEEILRLKIEDINAPSHKARISETIAKTKDQGNHSFEAISIRKDGSEFPVEVWTKPIMFEGRPCVIGTARDITRRKLNEAALEETGRRLATLITNLPGFVYRSKYDKHWTMEYLSDGCADVTGYEPNELIGSKKLSYDDMIFPEDQSRIWDSITEKAMEKLPFELEYRVVTKAGEVKWVWEKGRGVYDENGKVIALEGVVYDITARKSADDLIRVERDMAQKYLDVAGSVIALIGTDMIVQNVNEFAAELVGYPKEMIIGTNCVDAFIPKREKEQILEKFAEGFDGKLQSPLHYESSIVSRTGDEHIIAWRNTFLKNQAGRVTGILISGTDVTEIRHAQTQIEQSYERLERVIDGIVGALSKTVETKDPYTAGHQARVASLAKEIALEMGLPDSDVRGIYMAATIHDIGKIYVPAEILNKPGRLTPIEFGMIKLHPQTGYEVLKDIDFVGPVAKMVLQHHERMDGSGYPYGAQGNDISVGARILAVSDVVEAMSSHRPYRAGLGIGPALEEVSSKRGKMFDNDAVGACLNLFESKRFSFSD